MRLPADWDAVRTPGYGEVHYLEHEPCGFRTGLPYDLIANAADVRQVIHSHRCDGDDE